MNTHLAFIAFGANLGDPSASFDQACIALAALPGTRLKRRSALYRSAPVGTLEPQPDYLNAVIEIETTLAPEPLLTHLLSIERCNGRTREAHRAPRTLDLDLLLYDDVVIHSPQLNVPHPRMHERAFVLLPLMEIAPDAVIPDRGPVADFLPAVADQKIVRFGENS
ncbi:MAG TPA: 2-amino-4-hydroxy-6-hydroxymethyldihydropteridine diphosphokinase [Azoarcus sp.]|nr:2-amino-4-hydroxy-6-hydroxymethyldihydropteridine diphosphokinase [Azoarcus sp.]